ncbi:LuxR C-terminal-related transcriptional regulator [Marinicrinis lubricantis]|uniref:LuxR C-terminal-related transcriptional regulator n=1 Tax=Marinicrinis lubricantis TaxID=2086470 RepID=A0ABW1IV47_9BACL
MSVFTLNPYIYNKYWIGLEDIAASHLDAWGETVMKNAIDPTSPLVPYRHPITLWETSIKRHRTLLRFVSQEISVFAPTILKPHFYMLTDTTGMMLRTYGNSVILEKLVSIGMLEGASFQLEHAGINAVAASIHTGHISVVRGEEHTLHIFSDWMCICGPITNGARIVGYLDFSMHKDEDASLAAAILYRIISDIEKRLQYFDDTMNARKHKLTQYSLTPREAEVAARWLANNTTAQIAADLFISEETVRTYIKKIYKKTGSNGKGAFLQKFLLS